MLGGVGKFRGMVLLRQYCKSYPALPATTAYYSSLSLPPGVDIPRAAAGQSSGNKLLA